MSLTRRVVEIAREDGIKTLLWKARLYGPAVAGAALANGVQGLTRLRYRAMGGGTKITDEEWDNLFILDACRYDQFDRLHTLSGDLESRISLGSTTPEFLDRNFTDETCFDTVYVTASPMYRHVGLGDTFHDVFDVWESDWDDSMNTVRPEAVVEATRTAHEKYPNKRILMHFMQPHYPFLGETGRDISHSGFEWSKRLVERGEASRDNPVIWNLVAAGELDEDTVRVAYDENLELLMPHVEELIDELDGRSVVTSDHGNLLGKRIAPLDGRRYGHEYGTYVDELRKVPWLVVAGDRRRRIEAEPPRTDRAEDSTVVTERLADLGYVDA